MRRSLTALISLVVLGACSPLPEEVWPAETHTFTTDKRTYQVRAEFDPFEMGWFARVSVPNGGRLEPDDRFDVFDVVQKQLGPKVCEGANLTVEPEPLWTGHGGKSIRYLPVVGEWQLMGRCA